MTPLHLDILILAYNAGEPVPMVRPDVEIHVQYAGDLVRDGLIAFTASPPNPLLSITNRGKAYVSMLLQTPLPVSAFVDPRTERVISAP